MSAIVEDGNPALGWAMEMRTTPGGTTPCPAPFRVAYLRVATPFGSSGNSNCSWKSGGSGISSLRLVTGAQGPQQ